MDRNPEGQRRYQSWPDDLKREIVSATFEPGASVAAVARRYGVNANQVFSWRKRLLAAASEAAPPHRDEPAEPGLIPVVLTAEVPDASEPFDERIEIELAGGYRVRVGAGFHGPALRRVLDVLERR